MNLPDKNEETPLVAPKTPPRLPLEPAPKPKDNSALFDVLGTASTMGLHLVSGPIVGAVLGWLVDKWLGSWPVGAAIGLLFGIAAGFRIVWVDAKHIISQQDKLTPVVPRAQTSPTVLEEQVHPAKNGAKTRVSVPKAQTLHEPGGQGFLAAQPDQPVQPDQPEAEIFCDKKNI